MTKDAQKELVDWLDDELKLYGHYKFTGPRFRALSRLVKKFYGEWQKDANNLNIDFVEWPELVVLVESIRDFDPFSPVESHE